MWRHISVTSQQQLQQQQHDKSYTPLFSVQCAFDSLLSDVTFLWRHSSSCREEGQTSRHGAERRDGLYLSICGLRKGPGNFSWGSWKVLDFFSVIEWEPWLAFSDISLNNWQFNFRPNSARLLYVPIYGRLQILSNYLRLWQSCAILFIKCVSFGWWWTFWAYDGGST